MLLQDMASNREQAWEDVVQSGEAPSWLVKWVDYAKVKDWL